MDYTARVVRNHFGGLSRWHRVPLSPSKLQNLVYLAHGWHLVLDDDKPLVVDECAEAWECGPVFPSLVHDLNRDHGPIRLVTAFEPDGELAGRGIDADDGPVLRLLCRMWNEYAVLSDEQLSAKTCARDSPWDIVRRENKEKQNPPIPNEQIRAYYFEQWKAKPDRHQWP